MKKLFQQKYDSVDGRCQNCGHLIDKSQAIRDCFPHFRGKRTMNQWQKENWFTFTHWELHHYHEHKSKNLVNMETPGGACVRLFLNKYSDGVKSPKPFWLGFMLDKGIINHPAEFWTV